MRVGRRSLEQAAQRFHKEAVDGFLLAQVNATSARGTTFKTAPPTRPDVVRWITCSWSPHTQATIPGGFKKAKLTIATILPPPQSTPHAPPESDLG
ncbi:hypothetical protein PI125_g6905 [Phytophthora idaei]|nr:hypothetical protein PI125_g6905 [Phytophthora idaei]